MRVRRSVPPCGAAPGILPPAREAQAILSAQDLAKGQTTPSARPCSFACMLNNHIGICFEYYVKMVPHMEMSEIVGSCDAAELDWWKNSASA